ncbi:MAG: hypothetical protein IAG13_25530 [Deltaproteobacteria bacterium]|nr:hypothetical protein [Nannocystaceae bacterium]
MRTFGGSLVLAAVTLAYSPTARAAEVTRVATAFEEDNRFDIHFGVAYTYNFKSASILREWNSGAAGDDQNRLVKDLRYRQQRHLLTPSLEIGLWHDLALYMSLPITLSDQRDYSFDQRQDNCVYGDQVPPEPEATCVNKNNSTTVRDGIVPRDGFDASSNGDPFNQYTGPGTELIFKGPVRRGLDQLNVGLKYGILNQAKRAHMPTWIIGAEGRFAVGRTMTFSRDIVDDDPSGNHRVGRKIHELGLWTSISRRHRFLEPYFTAFWRQSLRAQGSEFKDYSSSGAQGTVSPQSTAGMSFGTEIVPFERKAKSIKVSVLLEGSAVLHYGGRGYSEIWELLADSPAMVGATDPTQASNCSAAAAGAYAQANPGDSDYVAQGGSSCTRFNGITDLQDYGTFGFNGALNLHLGRYARLMLGVNVQTDTRHYLTVANRGKADGGADDDRVEPNTREVNPVRRDVVDNVGRRYVIDDVVDLYGYARFLLTF